MLKIILSFLICCIIFYFYFRYIHYAHKKEKINTGTLFITSKDEIFIELEKEPKQMSCYLIDAHKDGDICRYSYRYNKESKKHYLYIEWDIKNVREIMWEIKY